ncbi:MAG: NAD+ synthase [Gemmatimonadetes bacterium]|nr:NAD+ synthase [Gemmatimonadota bacterium]
MRQREPPGSGRGSRDGGDGSFAWHPVLERGKVLPRSNSVIKITSPGPVVPGIRRCYLLGQPCPSGIGRLRSLPSATAEPGVRGASGGLTRRSKVVGMAETASPVRVELAQLRPRKGQVEANLARVRDWTLRVGGKVDLLVFPECVLSGYFVEGAVEEVARSPEQVAEGLGVPGPSAPDVVLGFYESGGGPAYNSVGWFTPDEGRYRLVHRHRKIFLPTYGVFDESRFVSPGSELEAFDTRFGRAGTLVCEEMLHSLTPTALALGGAELLVVVAASPARDFVPGLGLPANLDRWDLAGRATALEHGLHVAIAQLVGSEGGKLFAGGSTFYLPGGEIGPRAPLFEEGSVRVELDRTAVQRHRARSPLLTDLRSHLPDLLEALARPKPVVADGRSATGAIPSLDGRGPMGLLVAIPMGRAPTKLPDPEDSSLLELDLPLVERALVSFLRDEIVGRRGFQDVVVGVSGGVDSATALMLAVKALGPEHVHAFLLPYATSSSASLEDGRRVADLAGVSCRTIEITRAVDAYVVAEESDLSDLRRGNLAARFRALVLWDQAARLGALPLGTGNKSERLLGYFTWHADDSPPINPLGDLFKTQVWALARHLGVPEEVVAKAPSADLVPGVHDEDELGIRYELADRILHGLLEGYQPSDLVRGGFAQDAVDTVWKRLQGTHWKRELPTVATLSENAIGEFYLRPVDY